MSTWRRRVPRRKLLAARLRGYKRHPWEYACDTPDCGCCEPEPVGKGWERTPERDKK